MTEGTRNNWKRRMRAVIGPIAVSGMMMAGWAEAGTDFETGHEAYAKQNYTLAMRDFQRAAEAGDCSAQEILGQMYLYGPLLYGTSVEQNLPAARLWLGRAAAQQSEVAQYLVDRIDPSGTSIRRVGMSR